ncbi:choice-of-anchor Q domain-containing protein [Corallococcus sp. CA054B]|uniref:choice-of-anchor Q domain-containing protein n=1 Tax=Corallococcus sp. CA054B TaxID=2316734 RepID=UPI0026A22BD7
MIAQDIPDSVISITGGNVEIVNLTLQGGNAQFGGGIRLSGGSLQLLNSVVRDNQSFTGGGGLAISTGTTATIRNSSILNNYTIGAFGGGILNNGELSVYDSTIAGNESNRAGGIRNQGNMTLRNTTISGNKATSPAAGTGGISQNGNALLNNVTITDNTGVGGDLTSFIGGGIHLISGSTVVKNSIIAGNRSTPGPDLKSGPADCAGVLGGDSKYNLIGDSNGCSITNFIGTFKLNVPADLGPLASNGGLTEAHVPLPTSPALNSASPLAPPDVDACEPLDQWGEPRPGNGACDMGAVEVGVRVVGLMLVDATTDNAIQWLHPGETLKLSSLPPQLSIIAVVRGSAGSVIFGFDANPSFQTENVAPYALGGDSPTGNYTPVPFSIGNHTVTASPFVGPNGTGDAGGSMTVDFIVEP